MIYNKVLEQPAKYDFNINSLGNAEHLSPINGHPFVHDDERIAFSSQIRNLNNQYRSPGPVPSFEKGGPRIYTILMYLNDDFQEGETEFPNLNKKFKLSTGNAIFFHNLDNKKEMVHSLSLHRGNTVYNGEKWIATIWVRENTYT